MASYRKARIENGFLKGTATGVAVTIGAEVDVHVKLQVHAQTVANIYSNLEKTKSSLSSNSWEKIQKAHVGGHLGVFSELFDLMLGGSYDYYNKTTHHDVQMTREAQAIAKAIHEANSSDVSFCTCKSLFFNVIILAGYCRRSHYCNWSKLCSD